MQRALTYTRPSAGPVQLRLGFEPAAAGAPSAPFDLGDVSAGVLFVRHRRARHYVLRLTPEGQPRVTIPAGGSRREALEFLSRHRDWLRRQRKRHAALQQNDARRWAGGDRIWFRGVPVPVRFVDRDGRRHVAVGAHVVEAHGEGDLRVEVERSLRALAAVDLPHRLRTLAALHGLSLTRVTIRDQRTRWGSCSPTGAISLNWRLVQVPDGVRDYVLIHELMHLRRANHSRRFWRLVNEACPWHPEARRWLRRHGHELAQPITGPAETDANRPAHQGGEAR